jgi:hypothetical protein
MAKPTAYSAKGRRSEAAKVKTREHCFLTLADQHTNETIKTKNIQIIRKA